MVEVRIAAHVKFFDHMVQLFPSSYYNPVIEDEGGATEPAESSTRAQGGSDSEEDDTSAMKTPIASRATSMSELREKLQAKVQALGQPRQVEEKPFKKRKGRKSRKLDEKLDEKNKAKKQKVGGNKEKNPTVTKGTPKPPKVEGTKQGVAKQTQEENKHKKPTDIKGATKTPKTEGAKQGAAKQKQQEAKATTLPNTAAKKNPAAVELEGASSGSKPKKRKASDANFGQDLMFSSVVQDKEKEGDKAPGTGKKNVHRALAKVIKFEEKVKDLKQQDPLLAHEVVKQASISAALNRAQGIKVHDDKARLAKALKRKEKSKKKSQKEWKERTKQVNVSKTESAQKRSENIKAKLDERSANRLKRSIKKRGDVRALLKEAAS